MHQKSVLVSVLVVDDNSYIRMLVRAAFEAQPEFHVCGEAVNGREAIEKAKQLHPDLIILDFSMPEMDGISAASILSRLMPSTKLIMFTMHSNRAVRTAAKDAGICAMVQKEHGQDELVIQAQKLFENPPLGSSRGRGI